jgi:hypothetical protein
MPKAELRRDFLRRAIEFTCPKCGVTRFRFCVRLGEGPGYRSSMTRLHSERIDLAKAHPDGPPVESIEEVREWAKRMGIVQ